MTTAKAEAVTAGMHLDLFEIWLKCPCLERHRAQKRGSCLDGSRVVDQRVIQD